MQLSIQLGVACTPESGNFFLRMKFCALAPKATFLAFNYQL